MRNIMPGVFNFVLGLRIRSINCMSLNVDSQRTQSDFGVSYSVEYGLLNKDCLDRLMESDK